MKTRSGNPIMSRISSLITERRRGRRQDRAMRRSVLEQLEPRTMMDATFNVFFGQMFADVAGSTPLAAGQTAVILVDANGDGDFGDLSQQTDSFAEAGDAVLAHFSVNGLGAGPGSHAGQLAGVDITGLEGKAMLLVWYDTPFDAAESGPGQNVAFGSYRSDNAIDGSIAWTVPSDGSTVSLNFVTSDLGGSNAPSAGFATGVTGSTGSGGDTTAAITLFAGSLFADAAGNTPLPLGSTLVLLADANMDGDFGDLAHMTDSFAEPGDEVLLHFATNNGFGDPGTFFGLTSAFDVEGLEGKDLLLVWYNKPFNASDVGPGEGVRFGSYRTDDVVDGSDTGWFVPTAGNTIALNFATAGSPGGFNPVSAGFASEVTSVETNEETAVTIDDDRNTAADKSFTFTDADGDETTVSIKGPGTLEIALVGGVTNNADISLLALAGTDPSKTTVTIKVKRGSGDGKTSIARIEGTGVKLIDAKNSDLVGNTIELTGPLGELKIDDILDGADIILGGTSSDKFKLTADLVGNVNLTFPGLIDKLQVTNWADGSVHADAAKSIKTKVDKNVANSGAWGADLILTGLDSSLKETLGSFSADGRVDGAAFNITGDVKSFAFKAAVSHSSFTVASAVGKFDAKGALTDVTMTFDEYGSVTATSWLRGGLTAAFGKSVETKGDKKSSDDGDITDVALILTGLTPGAKAKEAISKIKVAGSATNLTVDVQADPVGTIEVKNATTHSALTLADVVKTLKLGDVSDTEVTAGSTSTIDVVRWLGGAIALTDAKSIKTKGSKTVAGDFAPTSVAINAGGTSTAKNALGSAAIKGTLSGAWMVTGVTAATKDSAASKIQADAIDADFIGHFMGDVGSLVSKSVFDGFASASNFGKIDVKTSMTGATIIAGGGATASSPNSIGSLKVGDSVVANTVVIVGVDDGANNMFDPRTAGDDVLKIGDTNFIKSLSVKTAVSNDSLFRAGLFPTKVKIGNTTIDPNTAGDARFLVN